MRIFGLTGGIASGKTTVSRMFATRGASVIFADEVAHDAMAPGKPAWRDIVSYFGDGVLNPDKSVNRPELARTVFRDAQKRAKLNAIVHPRVYESVAEQLRTLAESGCQLAIVEAALYLETDLDPAIGLVDGYVVVTAPEPNRLKRLTEHLGLTAGEAELRLRSQRSPEEKVKSAAYVIDNTGCLDETEEQVNRVWNAISETSA